MYPIRIFVSHAWGHNAHYYRLLNLLNQRGYFRYYDHSVPEHDPFEWTNSAKVAALLKEQIRTAQVVLVVAGVHASYRDWMQKELRMARSLNKPIIGVRPRGAERTSTVAETYADEVVNWNADSIVNAIRRWVR
ncbi:MAG TPA: TIR domain-containing protein [Candidatus Thermoplasmatota archaeon]|nr:TIR domain-containing protein [Candidatus Thermoplasmatota archaeon]